MPVASRHVKFLFIVLDQGKVCHCLPGNLKGKGIMKKVTNSDIGGGRSKIFAFLW